MSDFQQALDQISSHIKDCMARDQPGLQRRARSLAKRLEQKKPIDRSLPGLKEQVEKSVAQKQQRLDSAPGFPTLNSCPSARNVRILPSS